MFDLDNTIADREGAVAAWLDEFSLEHQLSSEVRDWILDLDNDGYSDRLEVFGEIRERLNLNRPLDQLLAEYQERVVQLTGPTPGAIDCLQQMRRRRWTLALVTNGSSGQQQGKIDALGIRDLFDVICVSGELGVKKPSPEIFEAAAERIGESAAGAWMVGDSPLNDVEGGRRLGMNTAWVVRGRSWPEDLPPPTVAVASLTDLVEAIDET